MKYRRSGIRGRGKASGSRMEDRGLKKRKTKVTVVQGAPEGQTDGCARNATAAYRD
jgi:hypothetical protein